MSDAGRNQKRYWFQGLFNRHHEQDEQAQVTEIDEENPWFALQNRPTDMEFRQGYAPGGITNHSTRWMGDDSSPLGFSDDDGTLKQLDHPVWRQAFGTKRKTNRFVPRDRSSSRWQSAGARSSSQVLNSRGSTWLLQTVAAAVLIAGGLYAQRVHTPLANQVDGIYQSAFNQDDAPAILPAIDSFLSNHHLPVPTALNLNSTLKFHAPVSGQVITAFSTNHPELTYQAASGAKVYAAGSGTVTNADASSGQIIIDHGSAGETTYRGVATIAVKEGEFVTSGQVIGHLQNTAKPTLEFGLERGGKMVNPTSYLASSNTGI